VTATWTAARPAALLAGPTTHLLCTLSLVVVVLNTNDDVVLFVPAIAAMAVGLLRPDWSRRSVWWLTAGALIAARQLSAWEGVDNHVVVTTYWCLALGVGLLADDPESVLARSARLIIGLVFGLAVYWKLASPDFLSGDFFRFTLLVDERFRAVAIHVAGVPRSVYESNLEVLRTLYQDIPTDREVELGGGPRLGTIAVAMTWFAVTVESVIAVAHLAPLPRRWAVLRPLTLMAFGIGTYLVVPVGGFGCLLATLALADDELTPAWRRGILWAFVGLLIYGPLWRLVFG
jgi:hypothetical protein